jgi:hypothetical protein
VSTAYEVGGHDGVIIVCVACDRRRRLRDVRPLWQVSLTGQKCMNWRHSQTETG